MGVAAAAAGVEADMVKDRVGMGWRSDIAAGILSHLDRIDVVEVIADDFFQAPRHIRRSLRTLAAQVPMSLHGVSLGLASCSRVDARRLDAMARLVGETHPISWSEHLAFVRAGGVEIGHLAAPPRCAETIDATLKNLDEARRIVGASPLAENIATLIEPPCSEMDEAAWIAATVKGSGCKLLLDLHNVYANGLNFGYDPTEFVAGIPSDNIGAIHIAGGKMIECEGVRRVLDDHLHPVPDPVFTLLEEVGARVAKPLTVILEQDGDYPSMEELLLQLDRAREALARGRARFCEQIVPRTPAIP